MIAGIVLVALYLLALSFNFRSSTAVPCDDLPDVSNSLPHVSNSLPPVSNSYKCRWEIVSYTPSEWENWWHRNLPALKFKVCATMAEEAQTVKSMLFMDRMLEFERLERNSFNYSPESDDLFSRQKFRWKCKGDSLDGSFMETLIEPLVGNTRDPFSICPKISSLPTKF